MLENHALERNSFTPPLLLKKPVVPLVTKRRVIPRSVFVSFVANYNRTKPANIEL